MRKLLTTILPLFFLAACGPTILLSANQPAGKVSYHCVGCPTLDVTNNTTSADYLSVWMNKVNLNSSLEPSQTYTLTFKGILYAGYYLKYNVYVKGYRMKDGVPVYVGMSCRVITLEYGQQIQPWIVSSLYGLNDPNAQYCQQQGMS